MVEEKILPVQPVELLSVTPGRLTDADGGTKVVAVTIRPDPSNSPRHRTFAFSKEQAERLRDDLNTVLNADNVTWCD